MYVGKDNCHCHWEGKENCYKAGVLLPVLCQFCLSTFSWLSCRDSTKIGTISSNSSDLHGFRLNWLNLWNKTGLCKIKNPTEQVLHKPVYPSFLVNYPSQFCNLIPLQQICATTCLACQDQHPFVEKDKLNLISLVLPGLWVRCCSNFFSPLVHMYVSL